MRGVHYAHADTVLGFFGSFVRGSSSSAQCVQRAQKNPMGRASAIDHRQSLHLSSFDDADPSHCNSIDSSQPPPHPIIDRLTLLNIVPHAQIGCVITHWIARPELKRAAGGRASCGPSTTPRSLDAHSTQQAAAPEETSPRSPTLIHGSISVSPSRSARPAGGHDGRPQRQRRRLQQEGSSLRQLARSWVCRDDDSAQPPQASSARTRSSGGRHGVQQPPQPQPAPGGGGGGDARPLAAGAAGRSTGLLFGPLLY